MSSSVLNSLVLPDSTSPGLPPPNCPPPPPPPHSPTDTPPSAPVEDAWLAEFLVDLDDLPAPQLLGDWAPPWCMATGRRGHCYEDPSCEFNGDGDHMPFYDSERGSATGDEDDDEMNHTDVADWDEDEEIREQEEDNNAAGETEHKTCEMGGIEKEQHIDDGDEDMMPASSRACLDEGKRHLES